MTEVKIKTLRYKDCGLEPGVFLEKYGSMYIATSSGDKIELINLVTGKGDYYFYGPIYISDLEERDFRVVRSVLIEEE